MTLSTRSRIFCGHFALKTAPRFSGCNPPAFEAIGAAFFRPFLGGGTVWFGPGSAIMGTTGVAGWLGTDACLVRDARVFFAAGGLGACSEVLAALEQRRGLARVLFATGIAASGDIMDGGSACSVMDIWGWSVDEGVRITKSPFRLRFLRTIIF